MSEAEATPAARIPRFAGAKRFQGLYVYAASGDTTDTRALQGGDPHVGVQDSAACCVPYSDSGDWHQDRV